MPILTTGDYDEVRAALVLTLTEAALPNAVISYDIFQGSAEQEILDRDPDALSYTAESVNARHIRRAAIYLTAARIAPSLRQLVQENFPARWGYTLSDWDPVQKTTDLTALAMHELRAIVAATLTVADRRWIFTTAPGTRGQ